MAVKIATELEEEVCITCGIVFAIPENYKRRLQETHKTFYCPNGHNMYFPAETEAEKLQRLLKQAGEKNDQLNAETYQLNRQLNGALAEISKMKKRANAGLCPHCHRHFANVERHIQSKHKDKV